MRVSDPRSDAIPQTERRSTAPGLSSAGRLLTGALTALLLALPAGAQELPRVSAAEAGMSPAGLERITATFQDHVERGRLPGAVTMILRDGRVVYHEAVGDRDVEAGDAMAPDDIFRIASQTKAVISVGVMTLVEDGELLLSDPLSKFLPAFEDVTVAEPIDGGGYDVVEAERPITIRHLLTHTAGLGYGGGPGGDRWEAAGLTGWYLADREEPIQAVAERMADLPLAAQPGEAWVYGYSSDVLGAVIEVVSGRPLDAFLRDRILQPLKMEDTHFYLPPSKRDRLTAVYNLRAGEELTRAPDGPGMETQGQYLEGPRTLLSGGAGLLSTAADYARFLQMLLNGGELDGARVLSPASIDLMTADHAGDLFPNPGMGFGLGFWVRQDLGAAGELGSVGEYGWGGAYHSTYWVDPVEELVVVYFTQVRPAAGLDDHAKLRALIYGAITESRSMEAMHRRMH